MTPGPEPRRTSARTRPGTSSNQSQPNVHHRAVDLVLHDLAQLARGTATDQRGLAQLARRGGEVGKAQLHDIAAGVHHHYALQLGQLAQNLHEGLVLRGEPTTAELLDYVDPHAVDDFGVDTAATPAPHEEVL